MTTKIRLKLKGSKNEAGFNIFIYFHGCFKKTELTDLLDKREQTLNQAEVRFPFALSRNG